MNIIWDFLAGLSTAGLLLPEAVAYALIAGVTPAHAIVAALCGLSVYALAGRSRFAVVAPTSSSAALLAAADVPAETRGAYLTAKALNRLVSTLKAWPLGTVRHVPLERGEVVAGGVALDEVEAATMRSRRINGLFLCGEVLDIAGPVGGYNLQAAWSTGWVAGEAAAQS